jgi:hypothetical protein
LLAELTTKAAVALKSVDWKVAIAGLPQAHHGSSERVARRGVAGGTAIAAIASDALHAAGYHKHKGRWRKRRYEK